MLPAVPPTPQPLLAFSERWWGGYHKISSYSLQLSTCSYLVALSGGPWHSLGEELLGQLLTPLRQRGLGVSSVRAWLSVSPIPPLEYSGAIPWLLQFTICLLQALLSCLLSPSAAVPCCRKSVGLGLHGTAWVEQGTNIIAIRKFI